MVHNYFAFFVVTSPQKPWGRLPVSALFFRETFLPSTTRGGPAHGVRHASDSCLNRRLRRRLGAPLIRFSVSAPIVFCTMRIHCNGPAQRRVVQAPVSAASCAPFAQGHRASDQLGPARLIPSPILVLWTFSWFLAGFFFSSFRKLLEGLLKHFFCF